MAPGDKPKPPYSCVKSSNWGHHRSGNIKICPLATRPYGWQLHCLRFVRLGCLRSLQAAGGCSHQRKSIENIGGLWLYTWNSSGWMDFDTFKITQACGDGFPPDIRSFLCFKGEGQHTARRGIWLGCSKPFVKMSMKHMKRALKC